jgi:hypothetical protein
MLSLCIAKWRNLLNSQSPVYDGDRQAPPDLLNLRPKGTDLDPDEWLMRHKSIPAFHVGTPAHHQAEILLDPKDTSRGICRYVPDPMDLEKPRVMPMEITFMDNGGNIFVLDEFIEQTNSYT